MRLTVGPLPPAVYWRRRALVLGVVLLGLFLIAQACMASAPADRASGEETATSAPPSAGPGTATPVAPDDPDPDSDPDPDGDPNSDADPDPDTGDDRPAGGTGSDADECEDDEILVVAETSATTVQAGNPVTFTIQIGYDSDRPCTRDVGGDQRELYLVRGSGADHVWSSQHCAKPEGSEVVELDEDWQPRAHHIGFDGRGTAECDGQVAAGPELESGEYRLYARLGSALSEPVTVTLR